METFFIALGITVAFYIAYPLGLRPAYRFTSNRRIFGLALNAANYHVTESQKEAFRHGSLRVAAKKARDPLAQNVMSCLLAMLTEGFWIFSFPALWKVSLLGVVGALAAYRGDVQALANGKGGIACIGLIILSGILYFNNSRDTHLTFKKKNAPPTFIENVSVEEETYAK